MALLRSLRARLGLSAARQVASGGWSPLVIRESFTGAWQQNVEVRPETAFTNWAVFGVITAIARDISKTPLLLYDKQDRGIREETTNPAYSAVLRRPNRYQTQQQFHEQWMLSKLLYGNAYALKERDARTVPQHLYLLDPTRVQVLVAPDGSVYYELHASDLAGVAENLIVPAREIMHDRWNCAFHPLQGISPLYAAAGPIATSSSIQQLTVDFFTKGGRPSGVLLVPTDISQEIADEASAKWRAIGAGQTMVLPNGMKYQDVGASAVDSQLVEQLSLTAQQIAGVFGFPYNKLDATKQPPYANAEATQRAYVADCLEQHFTSIATCWDEGFELPSYLEFDFDYDNLIFLDTQTKTDALAKAIGAGILSINEARRIGFGLGPVTGGDVPLVQQQYYPLGSERPAPVSIAPRADPIADPAEEPVDAA